MASAGIIPRPKRDPGPVLASGVILVAMIAWIAMIVLHPILHAPDHSGGLAGLPEAVRAAIRFCGEAPGVTSPGAANWIAGWSLMTVAMMLPPALPLLRAFQKLTGERQDAARLIGLLVIAFVGIWIAAGIMLYGLGSAAHLGLMQLPALAARPALLAGAAAILAGAYQFTPLKMACLDACRSPVSVMMTRWQPGHAARSTLRIGLTYGAICVGCCWALMILSVVAGGLALPIMVIAAAFMMLERLLPSVRRLVPAQAAFAIGIGLLLITGILPDAIQAG